jgi:hypothetical protein
MGSVAGRAALTLDASVRLYLARHRKRPDPGGWIAELGYVLYFGGMSGGLLVLFGWMFGADHVVAGRADPFDVALRVVAIASLFLVSHYAIQGLRLRLMGRSWRAYLTELALPGIVAEASLMPSVSCWCCSTIRSAARLAAVADVPAHQPRVLRLSRTRKQLRTSMIRDPQRDGAPAVGIVAARGAVDAVARPRQSRRGRRTCAPASRRRERFVLDGLIARPTGSSARRWRRARARPAG